MLFDVEKERRGSVHCVATSNCDWRADRSCMRACECESGVAVAANGGLGGVPPCHGYNNNTSQYVLAMIHRLTLNTTYRSKNKIIKEKNVN